MENNTRPNKRKTFSTSDERWILMEMKKNPKLYTPKLTAEWKTQFRKEANPETLRIILKKNNLNGRVVRKKCRLSTRKTIQKRYNLLKLHKNKGLSFWRAILFMDESKLNIFRSDCRSNVWRKPNKEWKENSHWTG